MQKAFLSVIVLCPESSSASPNGYNDIAGILEKRACYVSTPEGKPKPELLLLRFSSFAMPCLLI